MTRMKVAGLYLSLAAIGIVCFVTRLRFEGKSHSLHTPVARGRVDNVQSGCQGDEMPRILLADDHPLVRRHVREILEIEADFVVCAEASTGVEAVSLAESARPDIAILDLSMPHMNGLEAARRIHERFPQTELFVLTMYDPREFMDEVIASGVRTCILKTDLHHLLAVVRTIWQQRQNCGCASPLDTAPETPPA